MIELIQVVGARPNFVKMAPVIDALARRDRRRQLVVHTGQHYDERMSAEMLSDLGCREPDIFLGVGSGTHGVADGSRPDRFRGGAARQAPGPRVRGGDVNSTLAVRAGRGEAAGSRSAHVEAGLRSFDWTMPEEINRVLTDRLSTLLFTHSPRRRATSKTEGIAPARVHFVGNTMIDSLRRFEERGRGPPALGACWRGSR